MRSSSRSHCTTAPPMNTDPSSAYSRPSPRSQATVVRSRLREATASRPVHSRQKHPVPYVTFTIPGSRHAWPRSAACWSPSTPRTGISAPRRLRGGDAEIRCRGDDVGKHRARECPGRRGSRGPTALVDVEEEGPRRVRRVGEVSSREHVHQPGVHRAEAHVPRLRPLAQPRDVLQRPHDLRAGEVRIEEEPRPLPDQALQAAGGQRAADVGRPAILPDEGRSDRRPGCPVPEHGGLPLVGDPDRGDPRGIDPRLGDRLARRGELRRPDLHRVVLHPARASGRSGGTASARCRARGPSGRRRARASSSFPGPGRGCRAPSRQPPPAYEPESTPYPADGVPGEDAEREAAASDGDGAAMAWTVTGLRCSGRGKSCRRTLPSLPYAQISYARR